MSARLSRAELAVLLDDLAEFVEDVDVEEMLPEYAYNLGVIRASIHSISIGLNG